MASMFHNLTQKYTSVRSRDVDDDLEATSQSSGASSRSESLLNNINKNPFASWVGADDEEGVQASEEEFQFCKDMTYQQRVMGFLATLCLGYLISFGGIFRFKELVQGNPKPFVVMYTFGNVIGLCGSFFITGPNAQMKKMFHESRKFSSIIYLTSMVVTLVVAFAPSFPGKAFVLFILCIVETLSLTWYCLSYIPYGQAYVKKAMTSLMNS